MATATKKEEAYTWKAGARSRHTTNLKQSILRLSISMIGSVHQIIKQGAYSQHFILFVT
jgi:hypothetical protein